MSQKEFFTQILSLLLLLVFVDWRVAAYGFGHLQERTFDTKCDYLLANTNLMYTETVSLQTSKVFVFHIDRKYIQRSHTTNLRVEVATSSDSSLLRYPVFFIVRQEREITTLEVPHVIDNRNNENSMIFYTGARTLCVDKDDNDDSNGRNVTVRVITQSFAPQQFRLRLRLTEDFQIPMGKEMTFDVLPTAPVFFGFSFHKPDTDLVKIRVNSPSDMCMTVSIQKMQCPIHDLEDNVRFKGLWQTMSTTAAMTVKKSLGWFKEGFILVFVTHTDNEICGRKAGIPDTNSQNGGEPNYDVSFVDLDNSVMNSGNRRNPFSQSKTVTLRITDESVVSGWIQAVCLLLPIVITFLISFIVLLLFRNRHMWICKITRKFTLLPQLSPLLHEREQNGAVRDSNTLAAGSDEPETAPASPVLQHQNTESSHIPTFTNSEIGRKENKSQSLISWKSNLYIADFHGKQYDEVKRLSKRFYWTIIIVAVFYAIPVYQLVLHYLRVLYRTGEYDICYYNYLCAQRLGILIDFNHFWSNASYVIFGILYIVIVRRRSTNLCLQRDNEEERRQGGKGAHHGNNEEDDEEGFSCCSCFRDHDHGSSSSSPGKVGQAQQTSPSFCFCTFPTTCFRWDHGVPAHFGVFYALGIALTMEGFLSAAYHLCPNQSTFQFDTAFMYVIAVLLLIKIYQFRHPVYFGANLTFATLAGFVATSVAGLIFEMGSARNFLIFRCLFYLVQFTMMIAFTLYYYALGYVKDETNEKMTDWAVYRNLGQLKSVQINGNRLILPFISFTVCIAVLVYTEVEKLGFATYLLYLLIGNVLGMTLYYVGIMKPLHGEFKNRTWVQPTLYFLAAGVIGGFSINYFLSAATQWDLSASDSRAGNEECLYAWFPFHPFYDSHDAWHFLSAAALFLAFMGLLIVDDDLIAIPQNKIPVF